MQLHIVAASNRQPEWVEAAYATYARRFSGPLHLQFTQVRLARKSGAQQRRAEEGVKLLGAVPRGARVIALEERGEPWTTRALATALDGWRSAGISPCFVIGGPDGLAAPVLAAAQAHWSLSPLTLPHALARILVAEALYRASSLLAGHPYHRE